MKKLDTISFYKTTTDVCNRCGMDSHEANGCCHDELEVVKLEQDQNKATVIDFDFSAITQPIIIPSTFIVAAFEKADEQRHFLNHSPPLLSAQDTYLQNNVFRI